MAGLFDTLNLGSRSLATYRQAIDTTGHNLANVHTPGYTRQRAAIESVGTSDGSLGETGAGSEVVRIVRLHNAFLDRQIQGENSLTGALESREETLRQALTSLNETISNDGTGASGGGISGGMADFFNALQNLSNRPDSMPDRQVVIQKGQSLAARFNQVDARLNAIDAGINDTLQAGVTQANALLREIASLNQTIATQEGNTGASANNLRDSRQLKLEELSKLVKVEAVEQENGAINIVADGRLLVDSVTVSGTLEAYDPADGRLLIGLSGEASPLDLGGGLGGAIAVRDGELRTLKEHIHSLASLLISEVNQVHSAGFGLDGSTGADFFTGSDASDIGVNQELAGNPALLQAGGAPDASGDNRVILELAQLSWKTHGSFNGATFSGKQVQTTGWLGQELAHSSSALQDQRVVQQFLGQQRNALSGVSIDEEMASLVMFQKAFQASAKLISLTDEMLATIIGM